jgi:hypothetical protein
MATDVATFDVECSGKLIGKDFADQTDVPSIRARFLDSVGGYWLAKGQNFGKGDDETNDLGNFDVSQIERTKSLCRAKIAFLRATDFAEAAKPLTDFGDPSLSEETMGGEVAHDNEAEFPYRLQIKLRRANAAINKLPAGDVAAICKSE